MTDEELIERLRDAPADGLGTENLCIAAADRIEALRNEAVLNKAAYDGLASLLLSVQQDCIKERQRADRLEAVIQRLLRNVDEDGVGTVLIIDLLSALSALKGDTNE